VIKQQDNGKKWNGAFVLMKEYVRQIQRTAQAHAAVRQDTHGTEAQAHVSKTV
jgi:hypothetical protein